jgi:NAD(P)-dependent dehydrogenase (short-subunit alcohol dehydrogenase family)
MDLKHILFNKMGLDGQSLKRERALVTGGAMGIGRQTALGLARLGAHVAIIDREAEKAKETADQIRQLGGEALVVRADIAADGQLVNAVDEVRRQWQGIDILVNNAAEAFIGSFEEETQEVWDRIFNTNLRYPAAAIKFVLPGMLQNRHGMIANVISLEGLAFSTAYSATKVGMRSLTTSLSAEIGPDAGVWLFSFAPGIVDTPLVNNYFYTELAGRFGMTMQDIIESIGGNPGYNGLMPAEHCAASLVSCIVSARQYHGQMVNPFLALAKAGVIHFKNGLQTNLAEDFCNGQDKMAAATTSLREYLKSVTELNRNLEHRIDVRTQELTHANEELKAALDEVKQLSGLLPICSFCKNIRDDKGYWNRIETYIHEHSDAEFSHSVCNECAKKFYPDIDFHEK